MLQLFPRATDLGKNFGPCICRDIDFRRAVEIQSMAGGACFFHPRVRPGVNCSGGGAGFDRINQLSYLRTSSCQRSHLKYPFSSLAVGAQIRRKFSIFASGQGDEQRSTRRRAATFERSDTCNEELLLFLFQLDLSTRLQRALNSEQYEAAQQLREKIAEVEQEMAWQREQKVGSVSSKDEAQNTALTVLRLKAELQRAIDAEDYPGAAQIRDRISKVEAASLAASAKALVYQSLKYAYRLGQRVRHKIYGYLGVVCGMDPTCCESADWMGRAGVNQLSRGKNQPFYLVLVDVHEQPSLLVAYVAEDNLATPERGNIERFDHPYTYFLFYGMQSGGDFIPSKQLREKYNAARHESPWDEDDDLSGTDGST